MAESGQRMLTCPELCRPEAIRKQVYEEAGHTRKLPNPNASPYVPGMITPYEPKVYPPGGPPLYLPQPIDSTSGDILGMGPIGPWAPGHVDWTPQAGITGVRPVVDKYSITRYSTGDWRQNNERILNADIRSQAEEFDNQTKADVAAAYKAIHDKTAESTDKLKQRVKDLAYWKKKVQETVEAMGDEIDTLEEARANLKGASRVLMIPEAISRECLELRTHRLEPDLVRDDAEQELIKEVAIVGEIRRVFDETLRKVEHQLAYNKAAKAAIEQDWSDKWQALQVDKKNMYMNKDSSLLFHHPGVMRWPENGTTLLYWEHFCTENIRNCEEIRQKSVNLRQNLRDNIILGSQDMKIQTDRTNAALSETIAATEACCKKLEESLKSTLQKIADVENLIDFINETNRNIRNTDKLAMTRLKARNYERPNVENCRDNAQYSLMEEAKLAKETADSLKDKLREAESIRASLMKYRGDLEKEIACKRKSLNIDKDRLGRIRAHMPPPEEFAAA